MTHISDKLKSKVIAIFISELGEEPQTFSYDGEIMYCNGFWCRILNNKTIKKTHGLAWRKDNY